jgi:RNA polymerase sigma factor (sigma-70 family)
MKYQEFEKMIAKLAWKHTKEKKDFEELMAIGNLAFVKASHRFNNIEGCRSTFFYRCINNSMKDWLRKKQNKHKYIPCNLDEEAEAFISGNIDTETRVMFLEALFTEVSGETGCMIKDMLLNPMELFNRTADFIGSRFLRKAFKELMFDYGYQKEDINYAIEEMMEYLKEE